MIFYYFFPNARITQFPNRTTLGFIQFINEKREGNRILPQSELCDDEIEKDIKNSEQLFLKTLDKKKQKIFLEYVIPYLNDPASDDYEYFDLSIAQRWIFKRVLDMGWTVERFGMFDRNLDRYSNQGRAAYKTERIGKKYQWIAYHEFLARIADNFEFKGDSRSDKNKKYDGTWQIDVRDIDPSCLLKNTAEAELKSYANTWWFSVRYDTYHSDLDDVSWLKKTNELPSFEPLIEVVSPHDNTKWIAIEAYYKWEQPTPPEYERFEIPRREIWCMIKSYIVKKHDMEKLFEWAKKQNFMGQWMPKSNEYFGIFLGEFFWIPTFRYDDKEEWTHGWEKQMPKKVLVSASRYLREYSVYDCSIDETIRVYLPSKWIVERMGLRWNGVEGHFFDNQGNLIAFDPSIRSPGPAALLMNRDVFLKFLNDNGYDILWTILGEKNIMGSGLLSHDNWKGRLEFSGAYKIHENKVQGEINSKFVHRG